MGADETALPAIAVARIDEVAPLSGRIDYYPLGSSCQRCDTFLRGLPSLVCGSENYSGAPGNRSWLKHSAMRWLAITESSLANGRKLETEP
ncbi:hypothetical protein GOB36_31605 [Sinorhizobium meliloti]|uniref:hypothetical protein n=1 Tax=Rhizobium meliloti TaxID=382 RepID=UPI00299D60A1|nr:hypothetical protein [Sinorhizobium meliloti]MDX0036148.1 hypothetical protein [Sinorhizobium meliloti]